MNPAYRGIILGVAFLLGAIALDLAGASLQSLPLLIASFALAVAGAVTAVRGVIEFLSERA